MKRPNRKRYVNRAGIITVNYTKALEKYIDFLEAENKQFAISGVVGQSEQFYCQCDVPETDPLNPYSDDCYKCGDKLQ